MGKEKYNKEELIRLLLKIYLLKIVGSVLRNKKSTKKISKTLFHIVYLGKICLADNLPTMKINKSWML